jgi:4-hydroxybenzoate polyprenyltransferase
VDPLHWDDERRFRSGRKWSLRLSAYLLVVLVALVGIPVAAVRHTGWTLLGGALLAGALVTGAFSLRRHPHRTGFLFTGVTLALAAAAFACFEIAQSR